MNKRTDNPAAGRAGIAVAVTIGVLAFLTGGWFVIPVAVGLLAAVLGVLLVAAVIAAPFLVVGFGIYGIVHLGAQRRRAIPAAPAPVGPVPYQLVSPRVSPIATAPARRQPAPVPAPRAGLPAAVRARVERIETLARELLGRSGPSAIGEEDRALVRRTLDDYLPQALRAYRALPPGSGDWAVTAAGRTGAQLLEDQLDLIEQSLRQIEVRVWRSGTERMLAQQRFLEERFGPPAGDGGDDELRLPPPPR